MERFLLEFSAKIVVFGFIFWQYLKRGGGGGGRVPLMGLGYAVIKSTGVQM